MKSIIPIILLLVPMAFGQDEQWPPPNKAEQEQKRIRKELAKAEKERKKRVEKEEKARGKQTEAEAEDLAARSTVTLRDLERIPSRYVDKTLRLERVGLDEVRELNDGQNRGYMISISQGDQSTTAAIRSNGHMNFVLDETLGGDVLAEIRNVPEGYRKLADVWFDMMSIPDPRGIYNVGRVRCVVFLQTFMDKPGPVVGQCP